MLAFESGHVGPFRQHTQLHLRNNHKQPTQCCLIHILDDKNKEHLIPDLVDNSVIAFANSIKLQ